MPHKARFCRLRCAGTRFSSDDEDLYRTAGRSGRWASTRDGQLCGPVLASGRSLPSTRKAGRSGFRWRGLESNLLIWWSRSGTQRRRIWRRYINTPRVLWKRWRMISKETKTKSWRLWKGCVRHWWIRKWRIATLPCDQGRRGNNSTPCAKIALGRECCTQDLITLRTFFVVQLTQPITGSEASRDRAAFLAASLIPPILSAN